MRGLSSDQLAYLHAHVVSPIEQQGGKVWLFGSRARGNQNQYSDVDLLIEGNKRELSQLLLCITEQLEESNFPFTVDLVFAEDLAASYRRNVLRDRIPLTLSDQ